MHKLNAARVFQNVLYVRACRGEKNCPSHPHNPICDYKEVGQRKNSSSKTMESRSPQERSESSKAAGAGPQALLSRIVPGEAGLHRNGESAIQPELAVPSASCEATDVG